MKNKSLLEFLDEVSKERGFEKFSHSTDVGRVYVVEDIIKEAGKRYVKQYLQVASTKAEIGGNHIPIVNKDSIKNIEIDV